MNERTRPAVRALLDRYPRGYVAEEAGFTVTNTAAGLFRLLCLSVLAEDSVPSRAAVSRRSRRPPRSTRRRSPRTRRALGLAPRPC
jgi:hypothetical protein